MSAPRSAAPQEVWTPSRLLARVRLALAERPDLGFVRVRGEVSNCRRHSSGHCYFTVKDEVASIRCVLFRSRLERLKLSPTDGLQVVVSGQIELWERDGSVQIIVEQLNADGVGALYEQVEAIKRRLAVLGLLDPARKRPLPVFPRRVGIVTSPTGAALEDMVSVARRRYPGVRLVLAPSLVQGPQAPGEIVAALARLARVPHVDVIIVGRGGGSIEELWAFNTEEVARAIAACPVPVVSAVGHETDVTVADLVADVRAPTPSVAGELVVPERVRLMAVIGHLEARAAQATHRRLVVARHALARLADRPALRRPTYRIDSARQRLDELTSRLERATRGRLTAIASRVEGLLGRLEALNPRSILGRGYALVRGPNDHIVRRADELVPGNRVQVELGQGSFAASVLATRIPQ